MLKKLTPLELRVCELLADGYSKVEIAKQTQHTWLGLENRLKDIKTKLRVTRLSEIIKLVNQDRLKDWPKRNEVKPETAT